MGGPLVWSGWISLGVILLGRKVGRQGSTVLFFGRPSSTSAHIAGVEYLGGPSGLITQLLS